MEYFDKSCYNRIMHNIRDKNRDLRSILSPHEDKWVALSHDQKKVIASGETLKDVAAKVKSKDIIFMKVFPFDTRYAPFIKL